MPGGLGQVCQSAWSSVGDLGQSCLVPFFEAAELTEAVECHHRLHCGPVKQLQQRGADAKRLTVISGRYCTSNSIYLYYI